MSRVIPVALANHQATNNTTIADALKVTRPDGTIYGFTSSAKDETISGVTYSANPGMNISELSLKANDNIGNLELKVLNHASGILRNELLAGLWRNSAFLLFRYNWASPSDGIDSLLVGTFGEAEPRLNEVVVELRDLRQLLRSPRGSVSSKTCRYRLGSTNKNAGGICLKDISAPPFTVTGSLTHVTSKGVFRDSARAEAADYFGEGTIRFTSGNNSGRTAKVKAYAADGTFTVAIEMFSTVQVGDAYVAVVGCRRRYEEDCVGKFDNGVNFGGEPHRRGRNNIIQSASTSV